MSPEKSYEGPIVAAVFELNTAIAALEPRYQYNCITLYTTLTAFFKQLVLAADFNLPDFNKRVINCTEAIIDLIDKHTGDNDKFPANTANLGDVICEILDNESDIIESVFRTHPSLKVDSPVYRTLKEWLLYKVVLLINVVKTIAADCQKGS